ncbi:FMN reductase [Streptacidiphilus cavernicola]|uniref:FMN reductase n=1 Tax=Streptacidiphilus cavernicola TaxID=3342716 RepID=A0ABV6VRG3_9ACTN
MTSATVPVRLAVVSAGLSQPSSTRLLADRLAEAVGSGLRGSGLVGSGLVGSGRDVEVQVVELRELAHAIADNLVTGFPGAALREAVATVTGADALIAVTPVFSGSYSGLFKSFFDVIDNTALAGKPVLIAATGGTARHSLVLDYALRPLFSYLRAVVVPTGVYAASEDWGSDGGAHTDSLPTRITRAAAELTALLGRFKATAASPAPSTAAVPSPGARPAASPVPSPVEDFIPFAQQLAALRPAAVSRPQGR